MSGAGGVVWMCDRPGPMSPYTHFCGSGGVRGVGRCSVSVPFWVPPSGCWLLILMVVVCDLERTWRE